MTTATASTTTRQRLSLLQRPFDIVLLAYFVTHIPITLISDIVPLFPVEYVPEISKSLNTVLTQQFGDPLMVAGQAFAPGRVWFHSLLVAELVLQLPFFFYASYAIWRDSPCRRIPLLMYGVHVVTTMISTLGTLLLDAPHLSDAKRYTLVSFYVPYLLIPLGIIIQSLVSLHKSCHQSTSTANQAKKDQ
ncbi:hypothetical protein GQ42DRAFT_164764 [Ramicandelaber brevisporus]|nr:hypothetical protein GQ42DRAFT_164764 [Ramicandelaber brevisporus]